MLRKVRTALLALTVLLGTVILSAVGATVSTTVQASSHPAGATMMYCSGYNEDNPINFFGGWALAETDCYPSGSGDWQLVGTCLQAATAFGWVTDVAYGSTQWGTACDTNDSFSPSPPRQLALGNCYKSTDGVAGYRTMALLYNYTYGIYVYTCAPYPGSGDLTCSPTSTLWISSQQLCGG